MDYDGKDAAKQSAQQCTEIFPVIFLGGRSGREKRGDFDGFRGWEVVDEKPGVGPELRLARSWTKGGLRHTGA